MGNGALAIGPKLPRPSSTLPTLTFGRGRTMHLRLCQVREPDGLLDLRGRAPRKKCRSVIAQGVPFCIWPPNFGMEAKFKRPHGLRTDIR